MSLFRPYIYKNRPDLLDNAPVKKGVFRFLELYFRKFWRFLTLNLWYFLITLPMVLYVFYTLNGFFADRLEEIGEGVMLLAGVGFIASVFSFIPRVLNVPLLVISLLAYGPITMGYTYILRNFAREEHAWMSDFWSRAWSNVRQGLFFGIADILVVCLCVSGMFGGFAEAGKNMSYALSVIRSVVCGIALVIWLFMRHYTYLMAVTINLSVFHILKNAWLFVILGFGRNLLSLAVTLACVLVTFLPFSISADARTHPAWQICPISFPSSFISLTSRSSPRSWISTASAPISRSMRRTPSASATSSSFTRVFTVTWTRICRRWA